MTLGREASPISSGRAGLRRGVLMSDYTTWGVGGPADFFAEPADEAELAEVLGASAAEGRPLFFLGAGSNVLFSDAGFRGTVVRLGEGFKTVQVEPERGRLTAGAACTLRRLSEAALQSSLAGLSFLSGIPGTVGGALALNAGANGRELRDVLVSARLWRDGSFREAKAEELEFSYRRGPLADGEYVVSAVFRAEKGEREAIAVEMADDAARRAERHPRGRSAGSTFRNPQQRGAGRLIEAAGLAGRRRGGAVISEEHANFIINEGGATAADIKGLMDEAVEAVREMFGIELEPEVRLVGDF